MQSEITGILLAAGKSSRFGSNKLMQILPNGHSIIEQSILNIAPHVDRLICVIQSQQQTQIAHLKNNNISLLSCNLSAQGISASIACGIRASENASAWVIALADMPFIQARTYQQLVQHLKQGKKLCAPIYKQQRGHPAGFSSVLKGELLNLQGDRGANNILKNHPDFVGFATDDSGVTIDIDTPDDFIRSCQTIAE